MKTDVWPEPFIHPEAEVSASQLGRYTEVGARSVVVETVLDDYSYVVNDSNVIYTEIGKHVSIAAMTRINPGNHPTWRATQCHFTYRATQYFPGEEDEEDFFNWRRAHKVTIGHGRMQALGWWDWSHDELRAALPDFRSLSAEAFLDKYER